MNTATTSTVTTVKPASRTTQLALSTFLGLFVVGVVGFANIDVVHNAAHDYRHAMSFPCH